MRWALLSVLAFTNPLFSGPHDLEPLKLSSWDDVACAYPHKRYVDSTGKKWELAFHKHLNNVTSAPAATTFQIRLVSNKLEDYDPSGRKYATYDVIMSRDGKETTLHHLAFYLITLPPEEEHSSLRRFMLTLRKTAQKLRTGTWMRNWFPF